MRVALIGRQAFSKAVLGAFPTRGGEAARTIVTSKAPDANPDPLAARARTMGLPVFPTAKHGARDSLGAVRRFDVDLAIAAYALHFAAQSFRRVPRLGAIRFRPSLLPEYRGFPPSTGRSLSARSGQGSESCGRWAASTRGRYCCGSGPRSVPTARWAVSISKRSSLPGWRRCSKPPICSWPPANDAVMLLTARLGVRLREFGRRARSDGSAQTGVRGRWSLAHLGRSAERLGL